MKKSLNELHKEMRAVARDERKASSLPDAPLPVQSTPNVVIGSTYNPSNAGRLSAIAVPKRSACEI
jgi:hypothetical protein